MSTTPDDEPLPADEAAGPPQAARTSAAPVASTAVIVAALRLLRGRVLPGRGTVPSRLRCLLCIFSITRCSFAMACTECLPRGSRMTRAADVAVPRFPG
jgi:hypothetical protein